MDFVQANLGLQLARDHFDAKIRGFKQQVDLGSVMSGLAQVKVVSKRVEIMDRKITVV